MHILWITGTIAAGKGTAVNYLVEKKGYEHYSVRQFLIEEITKRNLTPNRDTMRELANELRATYGPAYIVEQLYLQAEKEGKDAIIESVRAIGEVETLKKHQNFLLLAIDANQETRYKRAIKRGSETDNISREQFQMQEQAEIANLDPNKQNIAKCIEMADIMIINNGSLEEFYQQIAEKIS